MQKETIPQISKIEILKKWLSENGCLLHKSLEIPSYVNSYQGVSAKQYIPYKTILMAIPYSLILTVSKCYNSPQLQQLFKSNDELFDYQDSEDAQFLVLCVFLMYHKSLKEDSEKGVSFWKPYLDTIADPQTAVDWHNDDLAGLNRSLLQEAVFIRRECKGVEDKLVGCLKKYSIKPQKPFYGLSQKELRQLFSYCYRAVMTRCFGFYFGQACMIPAVDLMNHGCQAINHQLMFLPWEQEKISQQSSTEKLKGKNHVVPSNKWMEWLEEDGHDMEYYHRKYKPRKQTFNCKQFPQLNLQNPSKNLSKPFRLNFLEEAEIVEDSLKPNSHLNRQKMDKLINQFNYQVLQQNLYNKKKEKRRKEISLSSEGKNQGEDLQYQIDDLDFCTEKDEEDNDTDEEVQIGRERQFDELKAQQQQMLKDFQDKTLLVRKMKDVERLSLKDSEKKTQVEIKSESSDSDAQPWAQEDGCYFTVSSDCPIEENQQIYNSYGARTNKFLLMWYGFAYRDNLYDSVSLRLHVRFPEGNPPAPSLMLLDTYMGGHGLISFPKHGTADIVHSHQLSKEFRIKRSGICIRLITFLRLYLLNYYQGQDLVKILITKPSSIQFELFVFRYYLGLVQGLYERYPLQVIDELKEEKSEFNLQAQKLDRGQQIQIKVLKQRAQRAEFKIIYLEEQRKILDAAHGAAKVVIQILKKIAKDKQQVNQNKIILKKAYYKDYPIEILRVIRQYLIELKESINYLNYEGKTQSEKTVINESTTTFKQNNDIKL